MSDRTPLAEQLSDEIKTAMKQKNKVRLRTLRSLRAALMNKEIDKREGGAASLSEQEELAVVRKQAKQRQDSLQQYEDADREDLASKEREELVILEEYLPAKLTEDDLRDEIQAIIDDVGATSMADMGAVMGRAMGKLRGRVDGGRVQQVVKDILTS